MDIDGIYFCSRCMRKIEDDTQVCPHCGYDPANITINSQHLAEGTFLNDRYLLGAVIGAGGFGVTYAAWDENLSVPVAIKEYFPVKYAYRNIEESDELLPHEESRGLFALGLSRFRKEAQVLAQFQNVPGIVNINECFDENETAYIAMEFVHGVPLDEYVQEHKPSPKKLLDIMLPAINALEIIHRQGINHRDIKPENLLVQEDGSIKLIDFGSAREVEHVTDMIVVSDGYAPLEQYDLKQPQGPWVDVYGISATIYHMLTGVMPEASISRAKNDTLKAPTKLGVKLKKYQEKALMAGLAVDPQKRIQSLAEFRAMLYNMPLPEEVRRRKAFVRRVIVVAVLTVLLMAVAAVNLAHHISRQQAFAPFTYKEDENGIMITGLAEGYEKASALVVPNGVTAIGDGAFYDCMYIKSITLPQGLEYIGSHAFFGCISLNEVALPWGLKQISGWAFSECPSLTSIAIPGTVISIDEAAFQQCTGLTRITLSEGVISVGEWAFNGCHNVENIVLPKSLTSIGERAFSYARTLKSIAIPDKLTIIGENAFDEAALEVITGNSDNPVVQQLLKQFPNAKFADTNLNSNLNGQQEAMKVFGYTEDENGLAITHIESGHGKDTFFVVPEGVTHIGENAFAVMEHIETYVPDWTHMYNYYVIKVSFPESLISIGELAFEDCENLSDITLPEKLQNIGDLAFWDCDSLTRLVLPEGLRSVGAKAFYSCSNLSDIVIPDGLASMPVDAFEDCPVQVVTGSRNNPVVQQLLKQFPDATFVDTTP